MMVLSGGTPIDINQSHVQRLLGEMGSPVNEIDPIRGELEVRGFLVRAQQMDRERGMWPISLTQAFIDLVAEELRRRGSSWPSGS